MAADAPFLRLPPEIRLQIYGHLYEPPEGPPPIEASLPIWGSAPLWIHKFELRRGTLYAACTSTKRAFWSILHLCKVVNVELLELLFQRMVFVVFISHEEPHAADEAPALGVARELNFWQSARRICLVRADEKLQTIKDTVGTLGDGFRLFKSTPQDTVAYLYLHDEPELRLHDDQEGETRTQWRRNLRSLASLSKRAKFEVDVVGVELNYDQERCRTLAAALNCLVNLSCIEHRRPNSRRGGGEEVVLSREKVAMENMGNSSAADELEADKKRVVCVMTSHARSSALRKRAAERRKERMMHEKRLFEGRLG